MQNVSRHAAPATPSRASLVFGLVLALIGMGLCAGGAWLAGLGGSWYYLIAGVGFVLSGVLLMALNPWALWSFALLVAGTLAWALWESGLDWWPLAARGDVLFVLGICLLTPWINRPLFRPQLAEGRVSSGRPGLFARGGAWALGLSLAAFVAAGVMAIRNDPHSLLPADSVEAATTAAAGPAATAAAEGGAAGQPTVAPGEWRAYGRTGYGQRYSPLDQITPANVAGLQLAWKYQTGDVRGRPGDPVETTFQVTPLKVGNRLFLCTPHQSVIALDATTGAEVWRYNPQIQGKLALQHLTCRGLSYQPPASAAPAGDAPAAPAETSAPPVLRTPAGQPMDDTGAATTTAAAAAPGARSAASCAARLFMPTADGRLIALNPDTGAVCTGFASQGELDLWANMPNPKLGAYYSTSPVVLTSRLIIVGGTVLDNVSTKEQSGVIRAYDIDTGALVWNWDSGNPEATTPIASSQTYTANSPNSWSVSSVDEKLGMVYVPLGNQPPDQWGGNRSPSVEKYSSSVVALDLATGKPRWHFQTVRHDLWDYDVPAQPSLIDLTINGASVPALVQPTKQGDIFVLDRRTGTPLLPVTELPAPQGAAEGDFTAPTQPRSALSFDPPPLTGRDMWGATMFDQLYCRLAFQRLRYEGRFTPPTTQGSLIYPGNFGVFNWGGIAVDPARQIAFTTPTYLAFVSQLVPRPDDKTLMVQGGNRPEGSLPSLNENFGAPFAVKLSAFVSPLGIPCQQPPWGYVAGADLTTGKVLWQHKNGTVRDESPVPLPFKMGVPNLGGPVMTAGGVAFLSGTLDNYVRGYDVSNGRQLWQQRLPAGGQATPMTYLGEDGRQYLLVVAGGHGSLGTKAGDHVLAYALPRR
ncbi:MAG: glucose dehydrogenase [Polaromonas sp.]|nr:glucose dehydrogenase [Polaromonas sp.]